MAEKLAQEYVRLVNEGWSPDLDEFLGRVPKELRKPCRVRIEGMTSVANETAEADLDDEPDVIEFSLEAPESPEPAGPQRLTKEEAMAMWDSQGRS